jgi:hypothetical protein
MTDERSAPLTLHRGTALKNLSLREMAMLGIEELAYIKPIEISGTQAYAVFSANGEQLAVVPNRAVALATVRHNDMEPSSVH